MAEKAVAFYSGKVNAGKDTFSTLVFSKRGDFRQAIKICFADYEAIKDISDDLAKQVRTRLLGAIERAEAAILVENPRYKGSLIDHFKGES